MYGRNAYAQLKTKKNMTPRIEKLGNLSLQTVYTISAERAILVTDFYENHLSLADSIPVQRAKGTDYIAGGTRYNTNYIQGVGVGTDTDSLTAIKHHVFEHKNSIIRLINQNAN